MDTSVQQVIAAQRALFATGCTHDITFRRESLDRLGDVLRAHEESIFRALRADLGKSPREAYMTELGLVLAEIRLHRRKLRSWSKPQRAHGGLALFPSRTKVHPEPRGVVAVFAPWNYPLQLVLSPLIGAVSAGNCAIVKPSEFAPATGEVVAQIVEAAFEPDHVAAVQGDAQAGQAILAERLDHIFFTGSQRVGRAVLEAAAKHLTPVTLELGGKSPCIVDEDADVDLAAKRIMWGKCLNVGQTCIAPDYALVSRQHMDAFINRCRHWITRFYGEDPRASDEYGRIINDAHFSRLTAYLGDGTVACGGESDASERYIAPTVLTDVPLDAPAMQEEIFGPLLPVLPFDDITEAVAVVSARPQPLALYYFGKGNRKLVTGSLRFGGGCVNDTVMHFAAKDAPFGGVGESGMGSCHGRRSFDTFTHYKTITTTPTALDLPVRYPGFRHALRLLRLLLK